MIPSNKRNIKETQFYIDFTGAQLIVESQPNSRNKGNELSKSFWFKLIHPIQHLQLRIGIKKTEKKALIDLPEIPKDTSI